jgi:AraC-like DNA-binding protein
MSIERRSVATSDFDVAVATMRSLFGDVELQRPEGPKTDLAVRSVGSAQLTATRWSLAGVGGGSLDRHESPAPAVLTGVLLGGGMRISADGAELDTHRPFLYPERIDSELDRADMANMSVPLEVLQSRASAMTGGRVQEVRFTGTAPISPALDGVWRDTVVYAARTLESLADLSEPALAARSLADHVALMMLHTFPNTALDHENEQRAGGARSASLRRALQYIEDNLDKPFSAPDLAEASRLSLRGLHAMFQRELQVTPMAYVRGARLAAARAELEAADAAVVDLAAVAARWGFTRVAQFAAAYRRAYGESPKETLER